MVTDRRTADIDRDALRLIFDRLYEKVLKRNEEEKHAADRHQRRAVDALRSRIKHLDPSVRSSDSWEVVRPRVEKTDEYRALPTDDARMAAFDKVIKRLKEKEEDADRDRERRRSRREEDRDYRNGRPTRGDARRGRLSRTPEVDAYEADRRKAMADREKSYRKSNALGPSPPPSLSHRDRDRDRDRRDRDDRHGRLERSSPPRHLSHYDSERRDREEARERLYRTRGDPQGSRDELNYGEESRSVTGSERRRRRGGESDGDSDGSARRTNKRYRRDRRDSREKRKSKTPEVKKEPPEPTGVHSGSEEGEIEED
jgi:pre-mRNA-processing factor 40